MITVYENGKLYIPLFYYKTNSVIVHFKPDDFKDIENGYIFPISGDIAHWLKYRKIKKEVIEKELQKDQWPTHLSTWSFYVKKINHTVVIHDVNLVSINGKNVNFTLANGSDKDDDYSSEIGIVRSTPVYELPHMSVRSPHTQVEEFFTAHYHVTKDIEKSIDATMKVKGYPGLHDNFAVIDISTFVDKKELIYKLL